MGRQPLVYASAQSLVNDTPVKISSELSEKNRSSPIMLADIDPTRYSKKFDPLYS